MIVTLNLLRRVAISRMLKIYTAEFPSDSPRFLDVINRVDFRVIHETSTPSTFPANDRVLQSMLKSEFSEQRLHLQTCQLKAFLGAVIREISMNIPIPRCEQFLVNVKFYVFCFIRN